MLIFGHRFAGLFHERFGLRNHHPSPPLDTLDRKILAILQQDKTTPQRTIGEIVNLSAPAVQRRIKRMTDKGVIRANVAIINPLAVGQSLTRIVEAKRAFAAAPEIQQCYYVTGEADFILVIVVSTMADYETLTQQLFFGNTNVKRFRTGVVMDRVKVGLRIPVET